MAKTIKNFIFTAVAIFASGAHTVSAAQTEKAQPAFVVHKLNDFLYAIGEPNYYQKNYSYLVVGSEKALMFDSGANQKEDITTVVKTITDKPLSVLPSHLHFDHLGGLHNFDSIYLLDSPYTQHFKQTDGLYHVPEPVYLGNLDHFKLAPFKVARLVKPDEVIDLGGVKLKLLSTPGHTRDEVALYDEAHNILLSGDHLYPSWLLAGNLKDYIKSVNATLGIINKQTLIYGAHADEDANKVPEMNYEEIASIRDKMLEMNAGKAQGKTFTDPDLIKDSKLYKVDNHISILTNIKFTDGRTYGY